MKQLTIEQVNHIIGWLNTWDQLKDTIIPLRFREHFDKTKINTEAIPGKLVPKWIRDEERLNEIAEAVLGYWRIRKKIPTGWVEEYNELINIVHDKKR